MSEYDLVHSRVRCNNCMSEFSEEFIKVDLLAGQEYCPICNRSGCLMDLQRLEKTLTVKEHWTEMETFRVRLVKNVFVRLIEKAEAAQDAGYDGIGIRDLKDSALEYGIEIEEGSDEQERDVAKT